MQKHYLEEVFGYYKMDDDSWEGRMIRKAFFDRASKATGKHWNSVSELDYREWLEEQQMELV